jgi:hypothetical protein
MFPSTSALLPRYGGKKRGFWRWVLRRVKKEVYTTIGGFVGSYKQEIYPIFEFGITGFRRCPLAPKPPQPKSCPASGGRCLCVTLRENPAQGIVETGGPIMNEVILHINDEISLARVISLLAPYLEKAEIEAPPGKVWTGKAEWLDEPVKMDSFSPLTRAEAHAR